MLYHLFEYLVANYGIPKVFLYLTFRAILSFFISFIIVLLFQRRFILWFRDKKLFQPIRSDGPESHNTKAGTPTMGGLVVMLAVVLATISFADLRNPYVWVLSFLTLGYGVLGFIDDYSKLRDRSSAGISARAKLSWQFILALSACAYLVFLVPGFSTSVSIPLLKDVSIELSYFYIFFAAVVIVGASNAVNLTDGLDGLVIGPIMTTAFAYGIFAYASGHVAIAEYLKIASVPGAGDLSIFAAALIAGGLGFLWYNSFPAQIFMGDVGALSLGGALGLLAVMVKQEIVLVIAGGVFVTEALSVILQVWSFKTTGKRIFRMAPLHHHFELKGMAEPKIIVRAWIISIILAIMSLATLKLH